MFQNGREVLIAALRMDYTLLSTRETLKALNERMAWICEIRSILRIHAGTLEWSYGSETVENTLSTPPAVHLNWSEFMWRVALSSKPSIRLTGLEIGNRCCAVVVAVQMCG